MRIARRNMRASWRLASSPCYTLRMTINAPMPKAPQRGDIGTKMYSARSPRARVRGNSIYYNRLGMFHFPKR